MITHDTLNSAVAMKGESHLALGQAPSRSRTSIRPGSLDATFRVYQRAVATAFGVRIGYLAADDEPLYSERLAHSLAMQLSPGAPGRGRLAAWASVLAGLLGFAARLLVATNLPRSYRRGYIGRSSKRPDATPVFVQVVTPPREP
jgi:hypothetical protein